MPPSSQKIGHVASGIGADEGQHEIGDARRAVGGEAAADVLGVAGDRESVDEALVERRRGPATAAAKSASGMPL